MINSKKFLHIAIENPDLPIVALVDNEVVGDDTGYWLGDVARVEVGEYAIYEDRYYTDREEFAERYYDHNSEELCERFNFDPQIEHIKNKGMVTVEMKRTNKLNGKKIDKYIKQQAESLFRKAIILVVTSPTQEKE